MKCPDCDIELPNGFKSCKECGTKLELACPGYGKRTPPDNKFCLECGMNLQLAASGLRHLPEATEPRLISEPDSKNSHGKGELL
jgi:hypothetical protein